MDHGLHTGKGELAEEKQDNKVDNALNTGWWLIMSIFQNRRGVIKQVKILIQVIGVLIMNFRTNDMQ